MPAPEHDQEAARLDALRACGVLDTAPEEDYDDLTRVAAYVCGVPIAAVSLIDAERQWFKSILGLGVRETPRGAAFCAHTILQPDVMVVPDARQDARFADNPLVTGDPSIRFYAGAPIVTDDGHALGSLCVIDRVPRRLTPEQEQVLKLLARQAASQMEQARRLAAQERLIAERERAVEALRRSEVRLREAQRLARIGSWEFDAATGRLSWSEELFRLFGMDPADGEPSVEELRACYHPDDVARHQALTDQALRDGAPYEFDIRLVRRDGAVRWAHAAGRGERDSAGRVVRLVGTLADIHERKGIEEALRESRRFAESVAEHSTSIIFVFDLGTMSNVYSNRHVAEFLGYSAEQVRGMGDGLLPALIHPDDLPRVQAHFGEFADKADGEVVEIEYRARHAGGAWRWIWNREVVFDRRPDGTPCRIMGTAQDVTERREAEHALEKQRQFQAGLLESLQEGIVACDADGTLSLFNRASREFHGLPEQPLPPERWAEHFDLYDADGLSPMRTEDIPLFRALSGQTVRGAEMVIAPQNGRRRAMLANAHPIFGARGEKLGAVAAMHDVTERRQAEQALARLAAIVESSEDAIWGTTLDGTLVSWNAGAERLYGRSASEVIGRHASVLAPPGESSPVPGAIARLRRGETVAPVEAARKRPDGSQVVLSLAFSPIKDAAGGMIGLACIARDVSARVAAERALRDSQETLRTVIEGAPVILYATDAAGVVTLSEGAGLSRLGLTPGEVVGCSVFEMYRAVPEIGANLRRALAGEALSAETEVGGLWFHTEMRPQRDESGRVIGVIAVAYDMTERKRAEQKDKDYAVVLEFQKQQLEAANAELEALATTDGLTGLKNHRAFQERLAEEVCRAERYGTPLSLVMLDVDHFKQYNDAFGHPAGDAVLRGVAHALKSGAQGTDVVARYGGEEFCLLLPQTDGAGASVIAERIREALERRTWPHRAVTASFGVATLNAASDSGHDVVARADRALYGAKAGGRNRVVRACHPAEAAPDDASSPDGAPTR